MTNQANDNKQQEITEEQKKEMQKELQRHFNLFKKRFKVKSKSELVAILWEQGLQFKQLQDAAKELWDENQQIKAIISEGTKKTATENKEETEKKS